ETHVPWDTESGLPDLGGSRLNVSGPPDDGGMRTMTTAAPVTSYLDTRGPYDLREVALMGFGHRDEHSFDGVMRLAFCVDGDYERQVGVEVRQEGERLQLRIHSLPGAPALDEAEVATIANQVARVVSVDHDGWAFERMCEADPVLS